MMTNFCRFTSVLTLASLAMPIAAQPSSAVFPTSADPSMSRPFMFSGATVRLSLDGRGEHRPEFAMRFSGGRTSPGLMPNIGDGVAFSAVPGANPRLTLAGQDTKQIGKRLNLSSGATIAVVAGGVLVVGLAVLMASSDKVPDDFLDDE